MLADAEGDFEAASALYEESLLLYRQLGDQPNIANVLINRGNLACRRDDFAAAGPFFVEGLALGQRLGNLPTISHGLEGLAAVAQGQGNFLRAIRIMGAVQVLREAINHPLSPAGCQQRDTRLALLRESVGEAAFAAAFAVGHGMTWEQAISEIAS